MADLVTTEKMKKQGWIRRLVGYMAPHKKNAYIAFGVAIGGQLIQSLLPAVQKVVIDDVITHHKKPLAPWLTLMIVMGVFTFVFAYLRRFRGGRIALDVQHDLRTAIFRQLQRLDFARHDEMSTGQLVSRASSDVALVQGFLQFLPIGVANILLFVVSLTVMFILSVPLALVMLAVAPLLLVTAMKLRTSVFPASWDAQQKAGDVANVVEEDVTGVRVVKGFGQEARELAAPRRPLGGDVRVARAAREHPGPAAAGDADDPRVRSGRGARARRVARAAPPHHARHVLRLRVVHAAHRAAGAPARRDPDRRPARPGRRRTHLRPARLDPARAGPARRARSCTSSAARSTSTT